MISQTTTGNRIDTARNHIGLTLNQLARRIGVKPRTLENWEYDRSEPRADKLLKLAGVLQVSLIWLLTGEGAQNPAEDEAAPETAMIAQKLDRAVAMQQALASLLVEIVADVTRLQREMDDDQELAA